MSLFGFLNTAKNDVVNFAKGAGSGVVDFAKQGYQASQAFSPLNPQNYVEAGKIAAGLATRNTKAVSNAVQPQAKGLAFLKNVAQGTGQQAVQLGESLGIGNTDVYKTAFQPKGPLQTAVLGNNPIPTIQKQFRDTQASQGTASAVGGALSTAIQDALLVRGGAETGVKGVKAAGTGVKAAGEASLPAAYRLGPEDRLKLANYSDSLVGQDNSLTAGDRNKLAADARAVANKAGIDITSGSPQARNLRIGDFLSNFEENKRAVTQGGYIGGPKAAGFNEAASTGKTFQGSDSIPRYEVDDSKATVNKLQPGMNDTLDNVLKHPTLYQDYPGLKNVKVSVQDLKPGVKAAYVASKNLIAVDSKVAADPAAFKSALLHETQHAIQNTEGTPGGTNLADKAAYNANPGEQEARAVGQRADLTPEQRAANPLPADQTNLSHAEVIKGFNDVRKLYPDDKTFYEKFVLPEAGKPTKSADLAQEIIGQVENNNVPLREAIDNSITPDLPKSPLDDYHAARDELVRIAGKNNQPQLLSQFDELSKGKSVAEKTDLLNKAILNYRDKGGMLAERFVAAPSAAAPAHTVSPADTQQLARLNDPAAVTKALQGKVGPGVADTVAPAIASTADKNTVQGIVDNATRPSLPPAPPSAADITAPATRPFDAQQTAFENAWNKGDINTAQQIVDTIPDKNMQKPLQSLIDSRKAELTKQSASTPEPQGTPAQRVIQALQGEPAAKGQAAVPGVDTLLQKQSALYGAERASRLAKANTNSANLSGREGLKVQLGALKGELPKVDAQTLIDHLNSKVSKEDVNGLLDQIKASPNLQGYEPIVGQNALVNLFDKGELPNKSEWAVLQKGLGDEFTTAVKTTALDSMTKWQTIKNYAIQILGAPKAVMASLDLSGGGRQGAVLGSRFMPEWLDAQKQSAKYFVNPKLYERDMQAIATSENKPLYDRMGIHLSGTGGTEEQFPTSFAEHLPGDNILSKTYNKTGGAAIAASDRAYAGGLTKLRAGAADHIINDLKATGIDPAALPDKTLKSIGRFIDTASGRGSLGALEKHATSLSEALFSPRLWKSRLDMLNPVYYAKLDPIARKYALQAAGSFASIAGVTLTLAAAAGAKVETDARSSDFLKIKVGDTRYDILGGFQQNLVLADRLITGQKKSSITGHITDLTQGTFGQATRLSVLTDFIQNKENPVFSTAQTILAGHDKAGNPVNPATEVGKLFLPLGIGDTYTTYKNTNNLPEALLKATVPGTFGIGVGTYGTKDIQLSTAQKQYVSKLTNQGASKQQVQAVTSFYQTAKTGPDRKAASDEIKKALQSGDQNKAVSLAQAYNKAYDANIQSWGSKNKQYANDPQLLKDYQAGLFSDESLYRMIDTINKAKGG